MTRTGRRTPRIGIKLAGAAGLVAIADRIWLSDPPWLGAGLALLTTALVGVAFAAHPELRRSRLARVAVLAAAMLALLPVERPSAVGFLLFLLALGVAVLAPRAPVGDAAAWGRRLAEAGLRAVPAVAADAGRLLRVRRRRRGRLGPALLNLAVPAVGGLVFLALFAAANPMVSRLLGGLRLPQLDPARAAFWAIAFVAAWAVVRPRGARWRWPAGLAPAPAASPLITPASVTVSLALFNLIFALQNGLDLAFLWSGAPLPRGVSFAEYAHRGAYPLIATALLAGLFVLVFLDPRSPVAALPWARRLVALWVAQNLFLVASSILRTLDYVDAYSLTALRLAALIWMCLVAVGLALIGWRLVRRHSGAWLVNANALAAGAVLVACSVVDLNAVAAAWNVRHAREAGGRGAPLDLCYLGRAGSAPLVSLARLEREATDPAFRERVAWRRQSIEAELRGRQADPATWTWRGARRLAAAERLLAGQARAAASPLPRRCDGWPTPSPLTAQPQAGS